MYQIRPQYCAFYRHALYGFGPVVQMMDNLLVTLLKRISYKSLLYLINFAPKNGIAKSDFMSIQCFEYLPSKDDLVVSSIPAVLSLPRNKHSVS